MAAKRRETRAAQHRKLLNAHRRNYTALLEFQEGHCAICPREPSDTRRLDLDHNHKEMFVRGLLCVRCNRNLPDWMTPEWLRAAADYLDDPPYPRMVAQVGSVSNLHHDGEGEEL